MAIVNNRILIVEDDAHLANSLAFTLKRHEYGVTTIRSAREALDMIVTSHASGVPFDLLISDIQLPDMTGRELVAALVSKNALPPTLVITAFGSEKLYTELKRLGVRDCMDKPFDMYELVRRVHAVTASSRS
jgi:two-component system OmpR family response regulator